MQSAAQEPADENNDDEDEPYVIVDRKEPTLSLCEEDRKTRGCKRVRTRKYANACVFAAKL